MKKDWKKYEIDEILSQTKNLIEIKPNETYKLLGLRLEGNGLFVREIKQGIEIRANQLNKIKKGDFVYSRFFAWKGTFDYVRDEFNGCYVSSEFPTFEINNSIIDIDFLTYYFIQSRVWKEVEQYCIGVTKASRNRFKEQERDIKNTLYSKYIDLIKDVEYKPMAEVAPIIRRPVKISAEEQYPELGIRCFGNGTFHKPALSGIEVGTKKLFQIKAGDLLFSNVFAWEGGIAVTKEENNDRYGSHRFISCNCDLEQARPSFLNFHFLSPIGLEEINQCSPGGAGRNKTLGLKKLEAIKVPIPKIKKQKEFENILCNFEKLKAQKNEQKKELSLLIPSLLDKTFNGEL